MKWRLCPAVMFAVSLSMMLVATSAAPAQESPAEPNAEPPQSAPEEQPEAVPTEPEAQPEAKPEAEPAPQEEPQEEPKEEAAPKDQAAPAQPEGEQQPEAKPEPEEAKPDAAPQEQAEPKAGEGEENSEAERKEDQPAPPRKVREFKPVEWDEKVEKVLDQKYPRNAADLKVIQTQTQRVIEHANPAVVSVQVGHAFGSAVIVSPEGLVLTAGHVVGKPGEPVTFIFADGSTARGKTLGMFREIDSGMMQITDPGPWPYVKMAEKNDLKTGEWVVVIAHPGGFDRERTPPVRLGRVLYSNDDVISTDCTLVGGDSGGPLFNMHGEVVGINSRIGRRITDNFHVPIGTYHDTWDRLVAGESWGAPLGGQEEAEARPLLGVTGNPRASECRLSQVLPGMPAERAGLKPGDVIRTFNGKQVATFDDLIRMVYSTDAGKSIKLQVARGDETLDIELRLAEIRQPLPGSADMPKKGSQEKDQKS